jgi:hypothetical protein
MGFLGSTDWAQATMEEIFQDVIQKTLNVTSTTLEYSTTIGISTFR